MVIFHSYVNVYQRVIIQRFDFGNMACEILEAELGMETGGFTFSLAASCSPSDAYTHPY